jgi:hypothetical protein
MYYIAGKLLVEKNVHDSIDEFRGRTRQFNDGRSFDNLMDEGRRLTELPLLERRAILVNAVEPGGTSDPFQLDSATYGAHFPPRRNPGTRTLVRLVRALFSTRTHLA